MKVDAGEERLRPGEAHPFVHAREGRPGCGAGLLEPDSEEASQLGRILAQLALTRLDRNQELDHGFGDVRLEVAVTGALVA